MILTIVASTIVCICGVASYVWYRRSQTMLKLYGNRCLVAVSTFEELCHPTHYFSDEEKKNYLNNNADLVSHARAYILSRWVAKVKKETYCFARLVEIVDNINKLQDANNMIYITICNVDNMLQDHVDDQKAFNAEDDYQAHHDVESYKVHCEDIINSLNFLFGKDCIKYLESPEMARDFYEEFKKCTSENQVKKHNEQCVSLAKTRCQNFFDTCLKYPLDEQQREAILHLEDNNLIIASAGSGKTSTMVGKARYMVEKEKIDPKKILIITYTRKAAGELSERLGIEGLSCSTFHALAVKIIGDVTGHKPSICEANFMLNCFYNLLRDNEDFKSAINTYVLDMRSLMKLEHDYDTAEEYYADRKKYGIQAMFKDMHGNMIFTKSEEERRICEWLSLHDVAFTYEEPYEHQTSTDRYRQYKPDFSVYFTNAQGKKERLYFEHFAIDKEGNVPLWFGTDYNSNQQDPTVIVGRWETANKTYKDGITWKKNLHQTHGTKLIYTTSAMFHDRTVWTKLEKQLKAHGVYVRQLSPEELFSKLVQRDKGLERSIYKLLEQFTILQKTNLVNVDELIRTAKDNKDSRSEFIIANIMKPFIAYYNSELTNRQFIDFTDAILQATQICKKGEWLDYEYILVDEFQDISKDRYLFLNSLRKARHDCFTKLFCVGDDWQSIYRFSGSDMTLFYDFEKYFGYTKHCKIETTYRFHDPLIKISSDFVQTNPNQVKKSIRDFQVKTQEYREIERRYLAAREKLPKDYDNPEICLDENIVAMSKPQFDAVDILKEELDRLTPKTGIEFHGYADDQDEKTQVESIIRDIPADESVLVIARYNYDSRSLGFKFTPQDADKKVIWLTLAGRRVRFMSVHGSKGLEADHVILINCNRGVNGFPSLIEDDPVLAFVLSDKDLFENAEERRVFYVAITRAKKQTHVFYNVRTPSCFVDEVKGGDPSYARNYMPCPTCGNGFVYPIKEGTNAYHGDWVALACTNKAGGCPYFKLMDKSTYLDILDDFNKRDAVTPVQETSKKMSSAIKEYIDMIKKMRELQTQMENPALRRLRGRR